MMEACARAELLASQADDALEEPAPLSTAQCAALVAADFLEDEDETESNFGSDDRTTMPITNGNLDTVQSEEKQEKSENIAPANVLETTHLKAKRNWWCNYSAGDQLDDEQHIHEQEKKKRLDKNDSSVPAIRDRKFELPELSRIFLGEAWRIVFTATTCFDLYGITWSIASVFASSLASDFSIRDNQDDYAIFILLFLVIVLGMSFFSIVEQLYVQLGFFVCRLIMVAIMLITVSIASTTDVAHFGEQEGPERSSPLADFRTLHL
jgi:hypothetical protein